MIKAIIFDVGGVLVDDPKFREFWRGIPATINLRRKFGSSKISFEEVIDKGSKLLNLDKMEFIRQFKNTYSSIKLKKDVFKIYKKIKLDKYILSDTNPFHMNYLKKNFNHVLKPTKEAFFSPEIKMRKSEIKTFKFLIKKIKKKPKEILFIDNIEGNIKNAKRAGMKTILFRNAKQLKNDLRKFNIKI